MQITEREQQKVQHLHSSTVSESHCMKGALRPACCCPGAEHLPTQSDPRAQLGSAQAHGSPAHLVSVLRVKGCSLTLQEKENLHRLLAGGHQVFY